MGEDCSLTDLLCRGCFGGLFRHICSLISLLGRQRVSSILGYEWIIVLSMFCSDLFRSLVLLSPRQCGGQGVKAKFEVAHYHLAK